MKKIEIEFGAQGHWLRQIWRENDVAIYERSFRPGEASHELELVIIRVKPESEIPSGLIVPEREAYPSASEWGTYGWSFPVRYQEWVLGLGQKLLAILKARASFVRQATSDFKSSGQFI